MDFLKPINELITSCSKKLQHILTFQKRSETRSRLSKFPWKKADYFIEIRLIDRQIKNEMKALEDSLSKKYHIGQKHYVPHISLVGGFKSSHEKSLVDDFLNICADTPIMKFSIEGWDTFSGKNNVAFLKIAPSTNLRKFRWRLSDKIRPYCDGFTPFDFQNEEDFVFHGTIALHIPDDKFKKTLSSIDFQFPDHISGEYFVDRVTVLKNHRILLEYDFLLREKLDRVQARNPHVYRFTENIKSDLITQKEDTITLNSAKTRVFLLSDSHFDHENIIRYVHRHFSNVHSMNDEIVRRWNATVKKGDEVIFLGDLTYGRGNRGIPFWLSQLQGNIKFIKGSHDKIEHLPEFHKVTKLVLENHPEIQFILSHDPKDIGPQYNDYWKIHGHHHNNNTEKFPFINGEKKTINVSVELMDYFPLDIEKLFDLNFTRIKYMKDISSEPVYFS